MKLFVIYMFLLVVALPLKAQNLIGYHKSEIIKIMQENQSVYSLDNQTKNPVYNYLKYVDGLGSRTILFFLSDGDTCTYYKLISDYAYLKSIQKSMDEKYRNLNDSTWVQKINKKEYLKRLRREKWFFTVTTRLKEE
jgi:hypothetical protein